MTTFSSPRRLLLFAAPAVLLVLLLVVLGISGLAFGPRNERNVTASTGPAASRSPSEPGEARTPRPGMLDAGNSETFVRSVAETLFGWDTATGLMPTDYTEAVLRFGDPDSTERAGLASDIANYLPSRQEWIELRRYATRQRLTIHRSYIPATWAEAVDQAQPGQLPTGATAVTIEGTRHRDGVWNHKPVATEHDVVFTAIVVCRPNNQSCHLLRLSAPNTPLQ